MGIQRIHAKNEAKGKQTKAKYFCIKSLLAVSSCRYQKSSHNLQYYFYDEMAGGLFYMDVYFFQVMLSPFLHLHISFVLSQLSLHRCCQQVRYQKKCKDSWKTSVQGVLVLESKDDMWVKDTQSLLYCLNPHSYSRVDPLLVALGQCYSCFRWDGKVHPVISLFHVIPS